MKSKENKEFKAKKPIFKRWWFWLIVVLVVCGVASGGGTDASTPAEGNSGVISNVDTSQVEPSSESTTPPESAGNELATSQEPADSEPVDTQEPDSNNPLISANMVEIPVMNGTQTERIGTAANIISDKSLITEANLVEFAAKRVDGAEYNWVTIKFPDDTGIVFPASNSSVGAYAQLADDSSIKETIGDIFIDTTNGTCTYEPASE